MSDRRRVSFEIGQRLGILRQIVPLVGSRDDDALLRQHLGAARMGERETPNSSASWACSQVIGGRKILPPDEVYDLCDHLRLHSAELFLTHARTTFCTTGTSELDWSLAVSPRLRELHLSRGGYSA